MITALVRFTLPAPITREEAKRLFESTARNYLGLPGLVRKYYLRSRDGTVAGGVYLWETLDAAEGAYGEAWRNTVEEKYGAVPSVDYFDTPVVVDNLTSTIEAD